MEWNSDCVEWKEDVDEMELGDRTVKAKARKKMWLVEGQDKEMDKG